MSVPVPAAEALPRLQVLSRMIAEEGLAVVGGASFDLASGRVFFSPATDEQPLGACL